MSKTAQAILTILVLITLAVNLTSFGTGSRWLFVIGRLLLMPAVVGLTFIVLVRNRDRAARKRFPGAAKPPEDAPVEEDDATP